jgi:outer membrane protein assembly factor BamB
VCPGLLGGVETPMAFADDRLFVPVVERRLPSANFGCATVARDVVFTSTYDGTVYGLAVEDGRVLWRARLRAGSNSCPAVAGDELLVGAGVPGRGSVEELVAYAPE